MMQIKSMESLINREGSPPVFLRLSGFGDFRQARSIRLS